MFVYVHTCTQGILNDMLYTHMSGSYAERLKYIHTCLYMYIHAQDDMIYTHTHMSGSYAERLKHIHTCLCVYTHAHKAYLMTCSTHMSGSYAERLKWDVFLYLTIAWEVRDIY